MTLDRPHSPRQLRDLLGTGETYVVPGAPNALTARLIENAGFEMAYITGAGIANTYLGVPDVGLLSLQELAGHVTAIAGAVALPLIVDADTGFGNALNVWHTVQLLERAGASAIQIEDQTFPKRCGHFDGKQVIAADEMVEKVVAAVEARRSSDTLIVARTDARAELGLDEACRRAQLYRDAGADALFVEAPLSDAEAAAIADAVEGPKILNIVNGGVTPVLPLERISELGYTIALYANLPLLAGIRSIRESLEHLRIEGSSAGGPPHGTWDDRQRLVRKDRFDEMSDRFRSSGNRFASEQHPPPTSDIER